MKVVTRECVMNCDCNGNISGQVQRSLQRAEVTD
jgi:hypothetical protein